MSFSNTSYSQPKPQKYVFTPQEDINAYEIAQLLPILIAAWKNAPDVYAIKRGELPSAVNIEGLSEALRRHFSPQ